MKLICKILLFFGNKSITKVSNKRGEVYMVDLGSKTGINLLRILEYKYWIKKQCQKLNF